MNTRIKIILFLIVILVISGGIYYYKYYDSGFNKEDALLEFKKMQKEGTGSSHISDLIGLYKKKDQKEFIINASKTNSPIKTKFTGGCDYNSTNYEIVELIYSSNYPNKEFEIRNIMGEEFTDKFLLLKDLKIIRKDYLPSLTSAFIRNATRSKY